MHILASGRIVASGGFELAEQLEADGYTAFGAPEPEPEHDKPVERPGSLDDLFSM